MKEAINKNILLLQEKAESSKSLIEKMACYDSIYDIIKMQLELELLKSRDKAYGK